MSEDSIKLKEEETQASVIKIRETPFTLESETFYNEEAPKKAKDVNIIELIKKNPCRLKQLKESLKDFCLIKKNIYLFRKRKMVSHKDIIGCECRKIAPELISRIPLSKRNTGQINCGENCWNRAVCTECCDLSCKCGDLCQNRRFQKHQDACIYPVSTKGKGWGLSAGQLITKGTFIIQYIGEVFDINSPEGIQRCKEYSRSTCTYLMKIDKNEVIDPTHKGNLARFINHSCDPNCITQKWHVLGEICIGIFAIRDIQEDEELTFDYQFDSFKTPLTKCLCNTSKCKGYLGYIPPEFTFEEWEDRLDSLPCNICGGNTDDDDDKLLLCDRCNNGFHIFCLDPPLMEIPNDQWFCAECTQQINSVNQEQIAKEKKEKLKKKKSKNMAYEQNEEEIFNYSQQYEEVYAFQKQLENKAIEELYDINLEDDDDELDKMKIRKRKELHIQDRKEQLRLEEEKQKKELSGGKSQQVSSKKSIGSSKNLEKSKKRIQKRKDGTESEQSLKEIEEEGVDEEDDNEEIESGEDDEDIEEEEEIHIHPNLFKAPSIVKKLQEEGLKMNSSQERSPLKRNRFGQSIEVQKRIEQRYQEFLTTSPQFLQRVNALNENNNKNDVSKKTILRLNKLEMHLFRQNFTLFEKLGVRTFWDHSQKGAHDLFMKNTELSILGNEQQIAIFSEIIDSMQEVVKALKNDMGIVEAYVTIPAIYLKRIIGLSHVNINRMEKQHNVTIFYHKRFITDECYPLDQKVNLLIKGIKENIISAHKDITEKINSLEVHRVFLTPWETKMVLSSLQMLKKKNHKSEFRLHRENPFKDINHPFFFIQVKEKELTLIGTKEENEQTQQEILNLINSANKDREEFQCSHYLIPHHMKSVTNSLKQQIESKVLGLKVYLFDPTPPRKNITLTTCGLMEQRAKAKQIILKYFEELHPDQRNKFDVEAFQDQMMYQMTKYLFKYMQNSLLTNDTSFMKNWDIVSPYMTHTQVDQNWFWKGIKKNVMNDYDTQLYICFVAKRLDLVQKFITEKEQESQQLQQTQQLQLTAKTKLKISKKKSKKDRSGSVESGSSEHSNHQEESNKPFNILNSLSEKQDEKAEKPPTSSSSSSYSSSSSRSSSSESSASLKKNQQQISQNLYPSYNNNHNNSNTMNNNINNIHQDDHFNQNNWNYPCIDSSLSSEVSIKKNILLLIKTILHKLTNKNINILKSYQTIFNRKQLQNPNFYRENFPTINFCGSMFYSRIEDNDFGDFDEQKHRSRSRSKSRTTRKQGVTSTGFSHSGHHQRRYGFSSVAPNAQGVQSLDQHNISSSLTASNSVPTTINSVNSLFPSAANKTVNKLFKEKNLTQRHLKHRGKHFKRHRDSDRNSSSGSSNDEQHSSSSDSHSSSSSSSRSASSASARIRIKRTKQSHFSSAPMPLASVQSAPSLPIIIPPPPQPSNSSFSSSKVPSHLLISQQMQNSLISPNFSQNSLLLNQNESQLVPPQPQLPLHRSGIPQNVINLINNNQQNQNRIFQKSSQSSIQSEGFGGQIQASQLIQSASVPLVGRQRVSKWDRVSEPTPPVVPVITQKVSRFSPSPVMLSPEELLQLSQSQIQQLHFQQQQQQQMMKLMAFQTSSSVPTTKFEDAPSDLNSFKQGFNREIKQTGSKFTKEDYPQIQLPASKGLGQQQSLSNLSSIQQQETNKSKVEVTSKEFKKQNETIEVEPQIKSKIQNQVQEENLFETQPPVFQKKTSILVKEEGKNQQNELVMQQKVQKQNNIFADAPKSENEIASLSKIEVLNKNQSSQESKSSAQIQARAKGKATILDELDKNNTSSSDGDNSSPLSSESNIQLKQERGDMEQEEGEHDPAEDLQKNHAKKSKKLSKNTKVKEEDKQEINSQATEPKQGITINRGSSTSRGHASKMQVTNKVNEGISSLIEGSSSNYVSRSNFSASKMEDQVGSCQKEMISTKSESTHSRLSSVQRGIMQRKRSPEVVRKNNFSDAITSTPPSQFSNFTSIKSNVAILPGDIVIKRSRSRSTASRKKAERSPPKKSKHMKSNKHPHSSKTSHNKTYLNKYNSKQDQVKKMIKSKTRRSASNSGSRSRSSSSSSSSSSESSSSSSSSSASSSLSHASKKKESQNKFSSSLPVSKSIQKDQIKEINAESGWVKGERMQVRENKKEKVDEVEIKNKVKGQMDIENKSDLSTILSERNRLFQSSEALNSLLPQSQDISSTTQSVDTSKQTSFSNLPQPVQQRNEIESKFHQEQQKSLLSNTSATKYEAKAQLKETQEIKSTLIQTPFSKPTILAMNTSTDILESTDENFIKSEVISKIQSMNVEDVMPIYHQLQSREAQGFNLEFFAKISNLEVNKTSRNLPVVDGSSKNLAEKLISNQEKKIEVEEKEDMKKEEGEEEGDEGEVEEANKKDNDKNIDKRYKIQKRSKEKGRHHSSKGRNSKRSKSREARRKNSIHSNRNSHHRSSTRTRRRSQTKTGGSTGGLVNQRKINRSYQIQSSSFDSSDESEDKRKRRDRSSYSKYSSNSSDNNRSSPHLNYNSEIEEEEDDDYDYNNSIITYSSKSGLMANKHSSSSSINHSGGGIDYQHYHQLAQQSTASRRTHKLSERKSKFRSTSQAKAEIAENNDQQQQAIQSKIIQQQSDQNQGEHVSSSLTQSICEPQQQLLPQDSTNSKTQTLSSSVQAKPQAKIDPLLNTIQQMQQRSLLKKGEIFTQIATTLNQEEQEEEEVEEEEEEGAQLDGEINEEEDSKKHNRHDKKRRKDHRRHKVSSSSERHKKRGKHDSKELKEKDKKHKKEISKKSIKVTVSKSSRKDRNKSSSEESSPTKQVSKSGFTPAIQKPKQFASPANPKITPSATPIQNQISSQQNPSANVTGSSGRSNLWSRFNDSAPNTNTNNGNVINGTSPGINQRDSQVQSSRSSSQQKEVQSKSNNNK